MPYEKIGSTYVSCKLLIRNSVKHTIKVFLRSFCHLMIVQDLKNNTQLQNMEGNSLFFSEHILYVVLRYKAIQNIVIIKESFSA